MKTINALQLTQITKDYGTPCWIYDANRILKQIEQLRPFDVIRFAQKACSNIHILRLMRDQGVAVDSVSLGEIERALAAGYRGGDQQEGIVFTADILDRPSLRRVIELDITVNVGSLDMLEQLGNAQPGHRIWLRINPGFGYGHSKKTNTGGEDSKHGIWYENLHRALTLIAKYRLHLIGLHMHIGSGVDYSHLQQVCDAMVEQIKGSPIDVEAISAGGGLSTPYRPGDQPVDTQHYFSLWDQARKEIEMDLGHPVRLEIEPGRFLVAASGKLVAEVRAVKEVGRRHFILVDAGFNDLVRPAMYGSYHEMSLIREGNRVMGPMRPTLVGGPLCESGDIFTQDENGVVVPRALPEAAVGDLLVFHDTGAYGASMSSNYNSRPLAPEVLVKGDQVQLIRRRQTMEALLMLETMD